jgi:hypothetical protein
MELPENSSQVKQVRASEDDFGVVHVEAGWAYEPKKSPVSNTESKNQKGWLSALKNGTGKFFLGGDTIFEEDEKAQEEIKEYMDSLYTDLMVTMVKISLNSEKGVWIEPIDKAEMAVMSTMPSEFEI